MDKDFQCAALYLFGVAGIDVVAFGQDEGSGGEHFSLPAVREAEIDDGCGRRRAHFGLDSDEALEALLDAGDVKAKG